MPVSRVQTDKFKNLCKMLKMFLHSEAIIMPRNGQGGSYETKVLREKYLEALSPILIISTILCENAPMKIGVK